MVLSLIQCNKVSALYIIIFQWFYVSKTRKCSSIFLAVWTLQACTCTPTFAGLALESALELADSSPDLANSSNEFVIVGRLPISNMFNISTPIQSADSSQPTIAVSGLQIGKVGMGQYAVGLLQKFAYFCWPITVGSEYSSHI